MFAGDTERTRVEESGDPDAAARGDERASATAAPFARAGRVARVMSDEGAGEETIDRP